MSNRRLIKLVSGLVALAILSLLGIGVNQHGSLSLPSSKPTIQPGYFPVTHVSDGDTFNVKIAGKTETVRLIGIDTPEVKDPRKPVQCFGQAASAQTHKLLDGRAVRLEGDPQDTDRDKYHRLLRYAYLADGTMVNQYLVLNGYAFAYTIFPNSKLEQFRGWEAEARTNNRGLWAGCKTHKEGDIEQTNNQ